MKTWIISCTTLTILQILDVLITGVSSAAINGVQNPDPSNRSPTSNKNLQNTRKARALTPNQVPATVPVAQQPQDVNGIQNTNGVSPDNSNTVLPTQFLDAGKNFMNTLRNESSKRGAGMFNLGTGLLSLGSNTIGSFGKLMNDQTKNVRQVSGDAFGMLNGLGDSKMRGIQNLFRSASQIGNEKAKIMSDVLDEGTNMAIGATRLGSNLITTPLGMGSDVLGVTNMAAKIPRRMSRFFSKKIQESFMPILGDNDNNGNGGVNQPNSMIGGIPQQGTKLTQPSVGVSV